MPRKTVLVIDDEADLIELVRYNLVKEGFNVIDARDGESGLSAAARENPDVIIVDLMLPGIDGLEVCRLLRGRDSTARIPVIMLTARAAESDRVVGLEMGADDYVTKPFSPRELAARVKAVLRRSTRTAATAETLRLGDLCIDAAKREVHCGKAIINLTATEFRLLQFLAAHPGRVFSRGEIMDGTLGRDVVVLDRTIDVHIVSLRKKLGACGKWIETMRGFGYRLRSESSTE